MRKNRCFAQETQFLIDPSTYNLRWVTLQCVNPTNNRRAVSISQSVRLSHVSSCVISTQQRACSVR